METLTKYSQSEEEHYILEACAGIANGRALDIGAWNAKTFSNTRALYERGWSLVMVEPSPEPFLNLLKEYGFDERVTLVNAPVGLANEPVEMFATADTTSTTDREHFRRWKDRCHFYGKFFTPCVTIADLMGQFGAFDFVSIDAEGISSLLFFQLIKTEMLPKCIVVEHDGQESEIIRVAATKHYHEIYRNGENLVLSR